jgi:hypothetical protein
LIVVLAIFQGEDVTNPFARLAKACSLVLATLVISGSALGAAPKITLQGTWEGSLTRGSVPTGDKSPTWEKNAQVRLVIAKGKVSVYTGRDGEWRESKPGKYQLKVLDTNAVIYSITTGKDKDGVWVETHSFVVTVIDSTHVHVMWQRQVRNKDMDVSNPDAVWGVMSYGELSSVSVPGA